MKIKQAISLLLIILTFSFAACSSDDSVNNNASRIKSILRQDYVGDQWYNTYKTTYNYEGNNTMMSSSLFQTASGENWIDAKRSTYTLSDSGHASEQIDQKLRYISESGPLAWVNDMRHTFTYNASGKLVKEEQEVWTSDNNWLLRYKTDYIYDNNAFLISKEYSDWYPVPLLWDTYEKLVYTNNAEGKPVYTECFNNGELLYNETTTYDADGFFLMSEQLSEAFHGTTYVSVRTEQTTLSNGNIDVINKTYYDDNGNITQQSRFVYEYD
ncbi:hypothetical protein [Flavobacterium sp.]|uniref:hypothetical protein n=1 Tax=Flavobacterium sp. TaxID=239 RepID=UPI00262A92A4|nr:hypothetical protein [Flavobacterium sp.]